MVADNQRLAAPSAEPPHSPEAEERLLSCCFIDSADVVGQCLRAGLSGADFFSPKNRIIFDTIVALQAQHESVTPDIVALELMSQGKLQEIGGAAYLAQVSGLMPTTLQTRYYLTTLRDLAHQRRKLFLATRLAEAIRENDPATAQDAEAELRGLGSHERSPLPPIFSADELIGPEQRPLPDELVKGLLHRGAKMMIAGGSKSFKTWVLLDLGISISEGLPWWEMPTIQGRVLYVNMEIALQFCEKRIRTIMEAKQLTALRNFDSWHLRGHARDFSELMPQMLRAIAGREYALIILDPVYKILGDRDENANGEVAQLLNEFEALAVRTGAAVAYGHHHSKGNQADKSAKDRASGAGAWTRDPDTLIDLTPQEKDEHFCASFTLRNNPPRPTVVVKWEYPLMRIAPDEDPEALKKPGGRSADTTPDQVARLLIDEHKGLSWTEWKARARNELNIKSQDTFDAKRNAAMLKGLVTLDPGTKRYFYTPKGAQK